LVDIIVDNVKYKEKLLLTNVKNVKNGQYYAKVIEEMKERCKARGEEYPFNVPQTRQKLKHCINICRNAVMKVKTSSGIRRFQEDKELGTWFGKLLPIISSMDNCQPQQAIEPGSQTLQTNSEKANNEETFDDVSEEELSPGHSSKSSDETSTGKRKYVPTPTNRKKPKGQTDSLLTEIKEAANTLKTLASDTSSKQILDFLKEESRRQAARDDAFLKIIGALVQEPHPTVTPPIHEPRNQFRYGMTNFITNSSMASHPGSLPQDVHGSQEMSYIQQLNNPNYP